MYVYKNLDTGGTAVIISRGFSCLNQFAGPYHVALLETGLTAINFSKPENSMVEEVMS